MASISNKQKQQQFGLILLAIVVVLVVAFSFWYVNQKNNSDASKLQTPLAAQRDSYNPADVTAGD